MALVDMSQVAATDLAYAAGVIDSDGCITVSKGYVSKKGHASYVVTACVAMKSDDVPQWFLATFGGCIRILQKKGKWSSSQDGRILFFPPSHRWEIYARPAAEFLEAIIPYLKLKKLRGEAAVKLIRMHRKKGRSSKPGYAGSVPISDQEGRDRKELALIIRAENQKGNDRVAMTAKWGLN